MVEVLEERMHCGEQAFSRSAKICCLMGMFSTAASMTYRKALHSFRVWPA